MTLIKIIGILVQRFRYQIRKPLPTNRKLKSSISSIKPNEILVTIVAMEKAPAQKAAKLFS
jgi:hypothetical protein